MLLWIKDSTMLSDGKDIASTRDVMNDTSRLLLLTSILFLFLETKFLIKFIFIYINKKHNI